MNFGLASRIWLISAAVVTFLSVAFGAVIFMVAGPPPQFEALQGHIVMTDERGHRVELNDAERPHPPRAALGIFVTTTLALLVASRMAARSVAGPLLTLKVAAQRFGDGDLTARARLSRTDEIGDVAATFDGMAERIASLVHGQRELLANVSHELRTPLARVRVALELAQDGKPDPTLARGIERDLLELDRLIDDILTASRLDPALYDPQHVSPSLLLQVCALQDALGLALERVRVSWPPARFEISPSSLAQAHETTVACDPRVLGRAFENLLDNAAKYSDPATTVVVDVVRTGDTVSVSVVDQGVGIAAEDLKLLGTPFFRADRSRSRSASEPNVGGIGLGLVLVRRITAAHGGQVIFDSAPGNGTRVTVSLPITG